MEILLGRPLAPTEHVHHLDGNGHNNWPRNLQLMAPGGHSSIHNRANPLVRLCLWCGRPFKSAWSGHGLRRCCSPSCGQRRRWHLTRARKRRAGFRGRIRI